MKSYVLLSLLTAASASAQLISIGAKGGVPFVDQVSSKDESRPYIVGPSVEVRVPAGFAIEADALYRRIGNTGFFGSVSLGTGFISAATFQITRLRGNEWEFPLLGKYYFRPRTSAWQPFVGTGYAFRTVGIHQDISQAVVDADGISHKNSYRFNSRSDLGVGAVFAAGIRFHYHRMAVLPEIRYTRWGSNESVFTRKNEAAVLLGISF